MREFAAYGPPVFLGGDFSVTTAASGSHTDRKHTDLPMHLPKGKPKEASEDLVVIRVLAQRERRTHVSADPKYSLPGNRTVAENRSQVRYPRYGSLPGY